MISEKDAGHVLQKHNFEEILDVPEFVGVKKEFEREDCPGNLRKDCSGKHHARTTRRDKGSCVNPILITKYNLSVTFRP